MQGDEIVKVGEFNSLKQQTLPIRGEEKRVGRLEWVEMSDSNKGERKHLQDVTVWRWWHLQKSMRLSRGWQN